MHAIDSGTHIPIYASHIHLWLSTTQPQIEASPEFRCIMWEISCLPMWHYWGQGHAIKVNLVAVNALVSATPGHLQMQGWQRFLMFTCSLNRTICRSFCTWFSHSHDGITRHKALDKYWPKVSICRSITCDTNGSRAMIYLNNKTIPLVDLMAGKPNEICN